MKILIAFIVGLIAAPILFGLAAILGWLPSDASSNPQHWESSIGMRSLDASLEKRSDGLTNPVKANDPAALAAGKKVYADNCAGCHGGAKGPSDWGAKGLYPRAPQFVQEGTDVNANEAYAAIRDGVRYSGMGAWRGQLSDQQMWQVANFVAHIQPPAGKKMDMDRD
jgi:mono/diheme cytochrome c family protein